MRLYDKILFHKGQLLKALVLFVFLTYTIQGASSQDSLTLSEWEIKRLIRLDVYNNYMENNNELSTDHITSILKKDNQTLRRRNAGIGTTVGGILMFSGGLIWIAKSDFPYADGVILGGGMFFIGIMTTASSIIPWAMFGASKRKRDKKVRELFDNTL